MTKIKPLFNRILAKIINSEQKTACGLEILQEEEEVKKAKVVEIGSSAQNCGIKIDDTIFFEPHTCAQVNIDTENYILICIEDILAIAK